MNQAELRELKTFTGNPVTITNENINEILNDLKEALKRKRPIDINVARCSYCNNPVSYTHLTLPTIYSV